MLTERKQKILYAIVRDYIESAEPVASEKISHKHHLDVSPATVRNEMMDLEEMGFIKQPHPSAGRIPSDKGYRFYVDQLMKVKRPSLREENFIQKEYTKIEFEPEAIFQQTLKIFSRLMDYVGVITAPKTRVYMTGLAKLLHQPEFKDITRMEKIVETLEDREQLVQILNDDLIPKRITVRIGSENKYPELKECSLIITSCGPENDLLGVIGPTRMSYGRIVGLMESLSERLEKILTQSYRIFNL